MWRAPAIASTLAVHYMLIRSEVTVVSLSIFTVYEKTWVSCKILYRLSFGLKQVNRLSLHWQHLRLRQMSEFLFSPTLATLFVTHKAPQRRQPEEKTMRSRLIPSSLLSARYFTAFLIKYHSRFCPPINYVASWETDIRVWKKQCVVQKSTLPRETSGVKHNELRQTVFLKIMTYFLFILLLICFFCFYFIFHPAQQSF